LKQEGIEKLADENPGSDANQVGNKSKYLNRNGDDSDEEALDTEARLEALRIAQEQNHTRQDVLDIIKKIKACEYIKRPRYRRNELVR